MLILIFESIKMKKKTIYSELEELIISILAQFLHFKIAIACLRQNSLDL